MFNFHGSWFLALLKLRSQRKRVPQFCRISWEEPFFSLEFRISKGKVTNPKIPGFFQKCPPGLSETPFKDRFRNHVRDFNNEIHYNKTEIFKYVWDLKRNSKEPHIR